MPLFRQIYPFFIYLTPYLTMAQMAAPVNPVAYTQAGNPYRQSFDGLPNTGTFSFTGKGPFNLSAIATTALDGWQMFLLSGTGSNLVFAPGTGSGTGSGMYSLGGSGQSDRSLGSLASGTGIYAWGLVLTNETGITLNSIWISFTACQWRKGGSGNRNTWRFRYKTGLITHIDQTGLQSDSLLNFHSIHTSSGASTLSGYLPVNQQTVSATISGFNWKPGEQLLLRWDDADEAGSDDVMAMDHFECIATREATAPTLELPQFTTLSATEASYRVWVTPQFSPTTIRLETDTSMQFKSATLHDLPGSSLRDSVESVLLSGQIGGLEPGTTYYGRFIATNALGTTTSVPLSFTTLPNIPLLTTSQPQQITHTSALLGGRVTHTGGAPIIDKGVIWTIAPDSTGQEKKVSISGGDSLFSRTISALPAGSRIYYRAYAINAAGTAWGDWHIMYTKTTVSSFKSLVGSPTNADTLQYEIRFAQPVSDLVAAQFQLLPAGEITRIEPLTADRTSFRIFTRMDTNLASIQLSLYSDSGMAYPGIHLLPQAAPVIQLDKIPPMIDQLTLPDRVMRWKDTIMVGITVKPENTILKLISGAVNNFPLKGFKKINDSSYSAYFIIDPGSADRKPGDSIPVALSLQDPAGNTGRLSIPYCFLRHGMIDGNRPFIQKLLLPQPGIYNARDSLQIQVNFSESIRIDSSLGKPSLPVTIGTRIRDFKLCGTSDSSIRFCYAIQPDETDMDGIRIGTDLQWNGAVITDLAGNSALSAIPNHGIQSQLLVDASLPAVTSVATPAAKTYTLGDTLWLTIQFSKNVWLLTNGAKPYIPVTIGQQNLQWLYHSGHGSRSWHFAYIIQPKDLDKDGLSISTQIMHAASIIDHAGNPALGALRSVGALSGVWIDALHPVFTDQTPQVVLVCKNQALQLEKSIFSVKNEEKNETIQWALFLPFKRGMLQGLPFAVKSSDSLVTPTGIQFIPTKDFTGDDTAVIVVTDGIGRQEKKIILRIHEQVMNNRISADPFSCKNLVGKAIQGSEPENGLGMYTYRWLVSEDSIRFQLLPTATHSNLLPQALAKTSWFQRIVQSGACVDSSNKQKIQVVDQGLWLGQQTAPWQSSSNWCGATIPGAETNIIVPDHQTVYINANIVARGRDIDIGYNSRLIVEGALDISGRITGRGLLDIRSGSLISSGNTWQKIDPIYLEEKIIRHLHINNAAGVAITDSLRITGSLSLHKGHLQTNNRLLLLQGSHIGASATGTYLKDSILIEWILPFGSSAPWISHPFQDKLSTSSRLFADLDPGSFEWSNWSPLKFSDSWDSIPVVHPMHQADWAPFQGARLTRKPYAGNQDTGSMVRLWVKGKPQLGDALLELPLSADTLFRLIGNPYHAPIAIAGITINRAVGQYLWRWNPLLGNRGAYQAVPFRSHDAIGIGETVIIQTYPVEPATLLFSEQAKQLTTRQDSLAISNDYPYQLRLILEKEGQPWDEWRWLIIDSARNGLDRMDAIKWKNPDANVYSLNFQGYRFAIDARPATVQTVIPIGLNRLSAGRYALRIKEASLPDGIKWILWDKLQGRQIAIQQDSLYSFLVTQDSTTQGEQRFEIRPAFGPAPPTDPVEIHAYPVPAKDFLTLSYRLRTESTAHISIRSINGILLWQQTVPAAMGNTLRIPLQSRKPGIYILSVQAANQVASRLVMVQ